MSSSFDRKTTGKHVSDTYDWLFPRPVDLDPRISHASSDGDWWIWNGEEWKRNFLQFIMDKNKSTELLRHMTRRLEGAGKTAQFVMAHCIADVCSDAMKRHSLEFKSCHHEAFMDFYFASRCEFLEEAIYRYFEKEAKNGRGPWTNGSPKGPADSKAADERGSKEDG